MIADSIEEISENSPANSEVFNKYQAAAEISNKALTFATSLVKPGVSVLEICLKTDEELASMSQKTFNKKKVPKGIAFPCCVSVNNVLGYFSPFDKETDITLNEGDLVKIELGAHIDGFPALVATSIIVGASKDKPATGEAAELVNAAHVTAEAALRLFRSGKGSEETAKKIKQVADELGVKFIEGMICHSISKDRLADSKMVVVHPSQGQEKMVEPCTFENYDVFVVDISISNGDGKVTNSESQRPTIFKRTDDNHTLRLKTSRAIVGEIQNKFGLMAFNVRQLEGASRVRMALNECTQYNVTNAYDVLEETKKDALTARIMFTIVLTPSGPLKITDPQYNGDFVKANNEVKSPELIELLKSEVRPNKKKTNSTK